MELNLRRKLTKMTGAGQEVGALDRQKWRGSAFLAVAARNDLGWMGCDEKPPEVQHLPGVWEDIGLARYQWP
jgi:hypothetical protein